MTWLTNMRSLSELAKAVIAVMVGVLLSLVLLVAISSGPNHDDIYQRQQVIERQLTYISCLLLIEPDQRTPEAVAGCQIPDTE